MIIKSINLYILVTEYQDLLILKFHLEKNSYKYFLMT